MTDDSLGTAADIHEHLPPRGWQPAEITWGGVSPCESHAGGFFNLGLCVSGHRVGLPLSLAHRTGVRAFHRLVVAAGKAAPDASTISRLNSIAADLVGCMVWVYIDHVVVRAPDGGGDHLEARAEFGEYWGSRPAREKPPCWVPTMVPLPFLSNPVAPEHEDAGEAGAAAALRDQEALEARGPGPVPPAVEELRDVIPAVLGESRTALAAEERVAQLERALECAGSALIMVQSMLLEPLARGPRLALRGTVASAVAEIEEAGVDPEGTREVEA